MGYSFVPLTLLDKYRLVGCSFRAWDNFTVVDLGPSCWEFMPSLIEQGTLLLAETGNIFIGFNYLTVHLGCGVSALLLSGRCFLVLRAIHS
jgi:hypothetical protein